MPTKPDYIAEELAARLIDIAEAQRAALIDELRSIHDTASMGSVPAPPAGRLLRLVSIGAFLSSRLSRDIQTAVDSGELDRVLDELELLQCLGSVRETSRVLCAYFLKYRFIDLSDLALPEPDRAGVQRPMERLWQLPEGTDTLWTDMRSAAKSKVMAMLPSRVTAAPWLGDLRPSDILQAIAWLTEMGLLEFAYDDCVEANGRPTDLGVAVLRLNDSFRPADPEVQREYEDATRRTLEVEIRRRKLVENLGTGLRTVGPFETYRLIADSSPNDVLKISTYHLRTVVGERQLIDWLRDKKTLRVRIMCLGPTTVDTLTEGADPTSLISSLVRGIQSFRRVTNELPRNLRGQVKIRVYGDREANALFRGAILCDSQRHGGKPKRAVVTVWPYGECRGNYGDILRLDGDSNLAQLLVDYFDSAWDDSVPLPFFRRFEVLVWILRSVRFELLMALLIGIIASLILAGRPNWGGDAFFALVATIPVLTLGLIRVGKRGWRALGLSIAVFRRGRGELVRNK
jgi:hypothetical protein